MPHVRRGPFDAVLLISFGGPQGPADIRPFLENVLRGRRVPAARVDEVAHHYELFGGVSPITEVTRQQAEGLRARLAVDGPDVPVHIGMRNWHPFLTDTLAEMSRAGVGRALGLIMAAQHSYSSCGQYRTNVWDARQAIRRAGLADVEILYAGSWYAHPGFVAANARQVADAITRLPAHLRSTARLVFTAHSLPRSMAAESRYEAQLLESARLVAKAAGRRDWTLVYQSRSGRPEDPWLEPDVCDYLRAERARGLEAVVLCPIGFVADHIEVLYDLDREAAAVCNEIGLAMTRAHSVGANPIFLDMLADVVRAAYRRYARGRPLPMVAVSPPNSPW